MKLQITPLVVAISFIFITANVEATGHKKRSTANQPTTCSIKSSHWGHFSKSNKSRNQAWSSVTNQCFQTHMAKKKTWDQDSQIAIVNGCTTNIRCR